MKRRLAILVHHCLVHPLAGIAYAIGSNRLGDAIHSIGGRS